LEFFGLFRNTESVPALSGLINDRERAICARFRQFRADSGLTQEEFANLFDLTRAQIAAIEGATTPLRYHLADHICHRFNLSQRWLATGKEPMRGHIEIPLEISIEIGKTVLLSAAVDNRLR
jgi:transcriptional regulator with XRE-family HTH domain